jgi:hypothetical protein
MGHKSWRFAKPRLPLKMSFWTARYEADDDSQKQPKGPKSFLLRSPDSFEVKQFSSLSCENNRGNNSNKWNMVIKDSIDGGKSARRQWKFYLLKLFLWVF